MDERAYWKKKHLNYAGQDWISRPTIFAGIAKDYFPPGGRLLELGGGQGQDARYFARLGHPVVCTDFSNDALQLAVKNTPKDADIRFEPVDLRETLPFAESTFAVVYAHMSLHYFTDQVTRRLADEIFRVLEPGGIFACLLNAVTDPEAAESEELEPGLYVTPSGLVKRFFDLGYLQKLVEGKFEPLLMDDKGETYKDDIRTLIRFVGKKK